MARQGAKVAKEEQDVKKYFALFASLREDAFMWKKSRNQGR